MTRRSPDRLSTQEAAIKKLSNVFVALAAVCPFVSWTGFALWQYSSGGRLYNGLTTAGFAYLANLLVAVVLMVTAFIAILFDILTDRLSISRWVILLFFVCGIGFLNLPNHI